MRFFFNRSRGSRLRRVTVLAPPPKTPFSSKSSKTAAGPAQNPISLEIKREGVGPAMHMLRMSGIIVYCSICLYCIFLFRYIDTFTLTVYTRIFWTSLIIVLAFVWYVLYALEFDS